MSPAPDLAGAHSAQGPRTILPRLACGPARAHAARPSFKGLLLPASCIRGIAMVAVLVLLAACNGMWGQSSDSPGSQDLLHDTLSVASAALSAGQPVVAKRLYLSLAERFPDAPEPVLGLGRIALHNGDYGAAKRHFLKTVKLARGSPDTMAEALLGAGRTALAQGDAAAARRHFRKARAIVRDPSSIPWIENGLAVAAALDGDYATAEAHYTKALDYSAANPGITANFVRMLVAAGRVDHAARVFEAHDSVYWDDGDAQALHNLIAEAREKVAPLGRVDVRLLLWTAPDPLPTLVSQGTKLHVQIARSHGLLLGFGAEPRMGISESPASNRAIPNPAVATSPPHSTGPAGMATVDPLAAAAAAQERFLPPQFDEVSMRDAIQPESWVVLLGTSRQWRLGSAARSVAAAVPEIADVQLLSPDVLYVVAKSVGSTSISALSDNGLVRRLDVTVVLDIEPLRALLAGDPEFQRVSVLRLARGVALAGDVDSAAAADRALRIATASLPEQTVVENNLRVGLSLDPLRALLVRDPGLQEVIVERVAQGVALTGKVASPSAAERAARLAAASLPEYVLIENNLRIELDVGPLRALLANDPDLQGVKVQQLARGVALRGEVESAAAADLALRFAAASLPEDTLLENNMRIGGPQQVNLEVQIAEVQRSLAEDFGFNWEVFGHSNDPLGFGFRIGRDLPEGYRVAGPERIFGDVTWLPGPGNSEPGVPIDVDIPTTTVEGTLSPTFILQRAWDNVGVTGMVDALAQAGLANVLARPNITAVSGETASFFSGGEYPLPTGFEDGVIVFEYKKYGVLLDFVPTIVDGDTIELTVRPEVSEPSDSESVQVVAGVNVPVMNVRRAETTVEVSDGESIVIAGLFRRASNEVESGVPLLKDLPIAGGLFGHSSLRSSELELIVTVTARLVEAGPVPERVGGQRVPGRTDHYYF